MGATVVALRLARERRAIIAHVGDSRAYRFRSGELEQLTGDHSFVAEQVRHGLLSEREAGESNLQNVLLRALGAEPAVQVDVSEELVMNDDAILLCSDGLTREVSDAAIAAVLGNAEDAREAADQLIDLANQAGGGDNITVIVIRNAAKPARAFARIGRWFRGSKATS
jgi:protein phosphatase